MGDQHHRLAEPGEDVAQVLLQLVANHRIQRAERLVEQEHVGVEHQGAHEADALALSSGELAGVAAEGVGGKAGELDELAQAGVDPLRGPRQVAGHEGDVAARR